MADILIAPYLPLSERTSVCGWSLIPFGHAGELEIARRDVRTAVDQLVEVYAVDEPFGLGALIAPPNGELGAKFDRAVMPRLGHALLAGTVNGNPPMVTNDEASSGGQRMATSENAVLYGHPVTGGRSYAVEDGTLVRMRRMYTAAEGEPLPKVSVPPELPTPMFGSLDDEFAEATLAILDSDDIDARRLHRMLDWFAIVMRNARAVTPDIRVEAARAGLEVLTGAGDDTKKLVRALGRLMRGEGKTERTYTADEVFWAKGTVQLTEDEWWMTRLCDLRNKIVHGDPVPEELWRHGQHHQIDQTHDRLIAALRRFVAERSRDALLVTAPSERWLHRAYERAEERACSAKEEEPTANE